MTREQADNWARVCANLTCDLPSKIQSVGRHLVVQMATANQDNPFSDLCVDGILNTLTLLGVPCEVRKDGEKYRSVEITGETFHVDSAPGEGGQ